MKYLNIGVHQICRNLQCLKTREWDSKEYLYGQTTNDSTIQAITEYCAERKIECNKEKIYEWTYFEIEVNERGVPGWEARAN